MDDDGFTVGTTASPTCNEGHDARSVECVEPGMWDKPFPQCVAGKVETYFILFLQFKSFLFNNLVCSTNVRTFKIYCRDMSTSKCGKCSIQL